MASGIRFGAVLVSAAMILLSGCGSPERKPVDLFPEDICASCRMAVSDHRCASEIITEEGEVLKFDDLGCLETYRSSRDDLRISAIFVMDYQRKVWVRWEAAVIVETGVFTPMASGKVAFADSARAMDFRRAYPPEGTGR